MADPVSGQLLFYTNSEKIWNRNHQPMPNGTIGPANAISITQVLIIQKPNTDSTYYVFTTQAQSQSTPGLKLCEVDMTLNAGLGGIIFKDSLLCNDTLIEGITAVRHANGSDVWVIVHKVNSNQFLTYLVTPAGVNSTPVVSAAGKWRLDSGTSYADELGEIKASPDGNKLAVAAYASPHLELFDFNKATGQIGNGILLFHYGGTGKGLYGVSFSPGGRYLYVSRAALTGQQALITQYDLISNDPNSISNSRVDVYTASDDTGNAYSLQLAPNGKIYAGRLQISTFIGVINDPDSAGISCNYVHDGVFLNGKTASWGLNNIMEYGFFCLGGVPLDIKEFATPHLQVRVFPNPANGSATMKLLATGHAKGRVFIRNTLGELLMTKDLADGTVMIEKEALGSGVFLYQLQADQQTVTGKFIIN